MQWWMRPGHEPVLGDQEALALAAEQRVGRDAHVLVEDLGVAAELAEARLAGAPSSGRRAGCSRPACRPGR